MRYGVPVTLIQIVLSGFYVMAMFYTQRLE